MPQWLHEKAIMDHPGQEVGQSVARRFSRPSIIRRDDCRSRGGRAASTASRNEKPRCILRSAAWLCHQASRAPGESLAKVKSWKRKACPGQPVTSGKRRTVTEEKKHQMRELAKQQLTNEEISKRVGLSVVTVQKHLRGLRAGTPTRLRTAADA